MVKKEIIKEKIMLNKFKIENSKEFSTNIFFKLQIQTTLNIGIDIKNDIFTDSSRPKFKILAPVIVIPDLLTPGINDSI